MSRWIGFVLLFALPNCAIAGDTQQDRMAKAIALQSAMKLGKDALQQNKPREAVRILEEQILLADGQTAYLELLRDAYRATIKELQLKNGSSETIEHIRRQLRTLELSVGEKPDMEAEASPPVEAKPLAEAPKFVEADPLPVGKPQEASSEAPLHADAAEHFAKKKYAEAAKKYAEIQASGKLKDEEKVCWGYCRLYAVTEQLKLENADPELLRKEVAAAVELGGKPLQSFGEELLRELQSQPVSVAAEPMAIAPVNFRVTSTAPRLKKSEVAKFAEQQRQLALERWTGARGGDWKVPCEIVLHETADGYGKATGRPPTMPGHSTVKIEGGKVVSRRIELHLEAKGLFDSQLPKEIHYVVLTELFADEPLPAWAEFGMTAQAEPAAVRSRNRRMMAKVIEEKRLPRFERLFENPVAPVDGSITSYYLAGVTVVDYLIRLKGHRTLVVFLQEAPRRGYEKSLSQHYGIKGFAELEKKWQADLLRGE